MAWYHLVHSPEWSVYSPKENKWLHEDIPSLLRRVTKPCQQTVCLFYLCPTFPLVKRKKASENSDLTLTSSFTIGLCERAIDACSYTRKWMTTALRAVLLLKAQPVLARRKNVLLHAPAKQWQVATLLHVRVWFTQTVCLNRQNGWCQNNFILTNFFSWMRVQRACIHGGVVLVLHCWYSVLSIKGRTVWDF